MSRMRSVEGEERKANLLGLPKARKLRSLGLPKNKWSVALVTNEGLVDWNNVVGGNPLRLGLRENTEDVDET